MRSSNLCARLFILILCAWTNGFVGRSWTARKTKSDTIIITCQKIPLPTNAGICLHQHTALRGDALFHENHARLLESWPAKSCCDATMIMYGKTEACAGCNGIWYSPCADLVRCRTSCSGVIQILNPSIRRLDGIDGIKDKEWNPQRAWRALTGPIPRSGTG